MSYYTVTLVGPYRLFFYTALAQPLTENGQLVFLSGSTDRRVVSNLPYIIEGAHPTSTLEMLNARCAEANLAEHAKGPPAPPSAELAACLKDVLDAEGDLDVMDFDRYRKALAAVEVQG